MVERRYRRHQPHRDAHGVGPAVASGGRDVAREHLAVVAKRLNRRKSKDVGADREHRMRRHTVDAVVGLERHAHTA